MAAMTPLTPRKLGDTRTDDLVRKRGADEINLKIVWVVQNLNFTWDLDLPIPKKDDSPNNRKETPREDCVNLIRFLTFKNEIDGILTDFNHQAEILYSGWVCKPKADRGVVPEKTRQRLHPVTDGERLQLQKYFIHKAGQRRIEIMSEEQKSPLSARSKIRQRLDDSPITSKLPATRPGSKKRAAEDGDPFKVPAIPLQDGNKRRSMSSRSSSSGPRSRPPSSELGKAIASATPKNIPTAQHQKSSVNPELLSRNTSFASVASSVFDSFLVDANASMPFLSQTTVPDEEDVALPPAESLEALIQLHSMANVARDEPNPLPRLPTPQAPRPRTELSSLPGTQSSSQYGSSFDEQAVLESFKEIDNPSFTGNPEATAANTVVDEELSQDLQDFGLSSQPVDVEAVASPEKRLRQRLEDVFPEIPDSLLNTPLHVRYEILRVFLHTNTPLTGIPFPSTNWQNYDSLWGFLRRLPALKGKTFPERISKEVWEACQNEFRHGSRGVLMVGSLRYSESASAGPLFQFRLQSMRLERTYRLRRRFGNDRFLEIDIPYLSGQKVPKVLQNCPNGKSIVLEWLLEMHHIIGRVWQPFCTKEKDRGRQAVQQADVDTGVAHRVFFFAVDGHGFGNNCGIPKDTETVEGRSPMSVGALLNWLRPTWENKEQTALKLFARTPLALSRNTPTAVLSRSQILYKEDLKCNGAVMTDGAGRMSLALAYKIVSIMGLSHLPSAFQGRIGEAKGLWIVDPTTASSPEEWLEVYKSQRKWDRSGTIDDLSSGSWADPAHRTFEVNKYSGALRPADLNKQLLPILVDRAKKSGEKMTQAISRILEDSLLDEIESQRLAMRNPQAFKKWIRDYNSGLTERVKHGVLQYKASLPVQLEEKLNIFLEAGFDPMKLAFLQEESQQLYIRKCDDLKARLNITVPRSTYAFMVPDFWGVLEENEVYLHFSETFVDELSPKSGLPLTDVDVLVARLPAHFVSDIQKVKAVFKPELMGLKDVIVFPTKGNPSLADKLSGGDYDGDIAWVCWEPTIVEPFENAAVPSMPNLVEEGFIEKDSTTYEELVKGEADPTAKFLKYCFEFNVQQSMLGICTSFKEDLLYAQKKIDSREARYLSTLLSNLVDQEKQGYIFADEHWARFKREVVKGKTMRPAYKSNELNPKSTHIIDRLMIKTESTVSKARAEFWKNMPKPEYWDPELVALRNWAYNEAVSDPEWLSILKKLDKDIEEVKGVWKSYIGREQHEETLFNFTSIVTECYELFKAIQPAADSPLTRCLLSSWNPNSELSLWALLRASVTFASYRRNYVSNFVWWMAGTQLCHLKAVRITGMVAVAPHMYTALRPDGTYIKLRQSEEQGSWEGSGENDGINYDD